MYGGALIDDLWEFWHGDYLARLVVDDGGFILFVLAERRYKGASMNRAITAQVSRSQRSQSRGIN